MIACIAKDHPALGVAALACMACAALGLLAASLFGCAAQPAKREAQLAAIGAGCKVALDLERDKGAAGAEGETERGCEAALRTLDPIKDGGAK